MALLVLCCLSGALLVGYLSGSRIWFADDPPIMPLRAHTLLGKIDPNTASASSLQRLPGIGPVLAEAIVQYRNERGPSVFATADDLAGVKGIGPATIKRIRSLLVLNPDQADEIILPQGKGE